MSSVVECGVSSVRTALWVLSPGRRIGPRSIKKQKAEMRKYTS